MNNITSNIVTILSFIIILFLLTIFYIEKRSYKIEFKQLNEINKELQLKYDSLLNAKQKVIIEYDTLRDTVYFTKLVPYKVVDTIKDNQQLTLRFYKGSVKDTTIKIGYEAVTNGTLENIQFNYEILNKKTTVSNILYVDKPVEIIVPTTKPGLYLSTDMYINNKIFPGLSVDYHTKKGIKFGTGVIYNDNKFYYKISTGLKIF